MENFEKINYIYNKLNTLKDFTPFSYETRCIRNYKNIVEDIIKKDEGDKQLYITDKELDLTLNTLKEIFDKELSVTMEKSLVLKNIIYDNNIYYSNQYLSAAREELRNKQTFILLLIHLRSIILNEVNDDN